MSNWASLHNHSYFSLLDGLTKPEELLETCINLNISACALSDHGTVAGSIKWLKAKKKLIEKLTAQSGKSTSQEEKDRLAEKIIRVGLFKQILACEVYVRVDEKTNSHLVILAKNKAGWKSLVKLTSEASKKENFFRKPRLSLSQIAPYAAEGNLISFSGHPGSDLYNILWSNLKQSFNADTFEEAKSLLSTSWKEDLIDLAGKYVDIFGKGNFFLEIQKFDQERLPSERVAASILRQLGKQEGIPCVATADPHYPTKDRAEDQRILLCNFLRTTLPKVRKAIDQDEEVGLGGFFKSDRYYIPSPEEMAKLHHEDELKNSLLIADMCEEYDLSNKPTIPKFDCPDGLSSDEYLRQLCRNGWKDKLSHLTGEERILYGDRVKYELGVLQGAGLSDYFLLVWDIVNWVKQQGGLIGCGRGSVSGSLVAFLSGITSIDSIKYNLIFERFFNVGRKGALPDIDMDIQASYRDLAVDYVKSKYGHTKVGKISTYGRMMGRSCLTDVLRAHEALPPDEIKKITSFIPDESAISDDLQEMSEEEDESGVILWTLQNSVDELKEWCYLDEDGNYQGVLGKYFEQAARMEGVYRTRGEHAAGVVICPDDIEETMPVVYDKDGDCTILFDMHDIEYSGSVKMDALVTRILDKFADAQLSIQNEFLL